jgi:uncharacterized protein (DUF58 family)
MKKLIENKNVFLTLEHLLKFEWLNTVLNFKVGSQKSNSILSGRYTSKLRGRGLDFEESRPYVRGDDIRNIDWNVTAKTGQTHTKVFTEEKEKPAFIFVDQSVTMGFGSTHRTKAVVAGELAAITAYKILKGGDRIGGMIFKGKDYDLVTPKRDRRNMLQFFQKIVDANHAIYNHKSFDFPDALSQMANRLRNIITHDFMVVVISDFYRYNPQTIKHLSEISEHNDVILVKIYDPLEAQLPKEKMTLSNITHQIQMKGRSKKVISDISDDFETNYNQFKSEVEKYNITVFKVNTVDKLEDQLVQLFTRHKHR